MVGIFLAGLIVGALLGLASAPLLRAWILWQTAERWRDAEPASHSQAAENEDSYGPSQR